MHTLVENKKSSLFIVKLVGSFIIVYFIYDYLLVPHTNLDLLIINSLIEISKISISTFGYEVFTIESEQIVGIVGSSGVNIGHACDGLSLFLLFGTFIFVFPGKWWFKFCFFAVGCASIHLINSLRITALAIIHYNSPQSLDFHHTYTFTLLVYILIFLAWILRIKIYSTKRV